MLAEDIIPGHRYAGGKKGYVRIVNRIVRGRQDKDWVWFSSPRSEGWRELCVSLEAFARWAVSEVESPHT